MTAIAACTPPADRRAAQWCILRTSPGRTIALAASLASAGFDVWSPVRTIAKRRPRSQKVIKQVVPIMPTFVFARAVHLRALEAIIAAPVSPHPTFSIFRTVDRDGRRLIPLVAEQEVAGARAEEAKAREAEERAEAKAYRRMFEPGTAVRVAGDAFIGLEAIVEDGRDGKTALVTLNGSGSMRWSISTYLLTSDELHDEPARAA